MTQNELENTKEAIEQADMALDTLSELADMEIGQGNKEHVDEACSHLCHVIEDLMETREILENE